MNTIELTADVYRVVYKHAADLIENGWTQYKHARDKDGNGVEFDSTKAVCFCLSGGILRAVRNLYPTLKLAEIKLLRAVADYQCKKSPLHLYIDNFKYNDDLGRTQEDVVDLLREVADHAEELV